MHVEIVKNGDSRAERAEPATMEEAMPPGACAVCGRQGSAEELRRCEKCGTVACRHCGRAQSVDNWFCCPQCFHMRHEALMQAYAV